MAEKLNPADFTSRKHFSPAAHVLVEGERLIRYKPNRGPSEIEGRYVVESTTKTTATLTRVGGSGPGGIIRVQRVSAGYEVAKFSFDPIGEGSYPRPYFLETPEVLAAAEQAAKDAKVIKQAAAMVARFTGKLSAEEAAKVVKALSAITPIPE